MFDGSSRRGIVRPSIVDLGLFQLDRAQALEEKGAAFAERVGGWLPFQNEHFPGSRFEVSRVRAYAVCFGHMVQLAEEDWLLDWFTTNDKTFACFKDGLDIVLALGAPVRCELPLVMLGDYFASNAAERFGACFCALGGVLYPSLMAAPRLGWHKHTQFLVLDETIPPGE
ncbi:MAG TPA: hypothetical protein VN495_03930 [Candidatus Paceibacterota bacterium]|nr:hypothetical protein [Candidatus Paceibacterota bacterium]